MKRILLAVAVLMAGTAGMAQQTTPTTTAAPKKTKTKTDWSKMDLGKRSADHFMIQFGYAGWAGKPDSINSGGFSRTFNMYLLFDFVFKSNPRFSVAIGPGIGTDNIFFENTRIDLNNRQEIRFNRDTVNQYKKYKLQTGYLEVPVELRFAANPANMNKSFKVALGVKVGTNIEGKTKAKVDLDENRQGGYVEKVKNRTFFNGTRVAAMARIGYGNLSLFGSYTLSNMFKEGQGPQGIRPFSIGLTLSGL